MRLALAIASFIALLIHGIVFVDQFFHDWEQHQTAYFSQALSEARNDAEKAELQARSPRIEQIMVTQFGGTWVDRCTTCHIAIDDPRFEEHFLPLKTHPYSEALGDKEVGGRWERAHKFADFGCTVCHDGQGRGLQEYYSHGEDHMWPRPLLGYVVQDNWSDKNAPRLTGIEYMEANCAQCHTEENFAGTPTLNKGRELFFSTNCNGCHRIEGLSDGTLGPDLTGIGEHFSLDYLWDAIVDPRANSAVSFMPAFHLSDDEVRALVIFLKSRRGVNFNETSLDRYRASLSAPPPSRSADLPMTIEATAEMSSTGQQLIQDRACLACHKLGDADGGVAPDLSWTGLMRNDTWLLEHFRNPRGPVSDSIMPAFQYRDEEFQAMTAYLLSLDDPQPHTDPAAIYREACARCHGEGGAGDGPIAVYIDPAPRDLTKAAFMNSKTMERLATSIREGVPGTSMPPLARVVGDDNVEPLLEYMQAEFVKRPRRERKPRSIPETNPVAMSEDSVARGEATYLRRCTGCHGLKADGKGPNSLDIIPRPRNLRNREFVNSLSDQRLFESLMYGIQGTAMPPWIDYGLSNNDIGDLVNYIRNLHSGS